MLRDRARRSVSRPEFGPTTGFSSRVFLDNEKGFGLAFVPDFSLLAVEYNIAVTRSRGILLGLQDEPDECRLVEPGVVVFGYPIRKRLVPDLLIEDPLFLDKLTSDISVSYFHSHQAVVKVESLLHRGQMNWPDIQHLWSSAVRFNAYQLDLFMPTSIYPIILAQLFPNAPKNWGDGILSELYMPRYEKTYLEEQHLSIVQCIASGQELTHAADLISNSVGYLDTYDLSPGWLEDLQTATKTIKKYQERFTPASAAEEIENDRSGRIQRRARQQDILTSIGTAINSRGGRESLVLGKEIADPPWASQFFSSCASRIHNDEECRLFLRQMFEYIQPAMTYDQQTRRLRARTFRAFRHVLDELSLNRDSTSWETLSVRNKSMQVP